MLGQGFHEIQAFGPHSSTTPAASSPLVPPITKRDSSSERPSATSPISELANFPRLSAARSSNKSSTSSVIRRSTSTHWTQTILSSQQAPASLPSAETHQTPVPKFTVKQQYSKSHSVAAASIRSTTAESAPVSTETSLYRTYLHSRSTISAQYGNSTVSVGTGTRSHPIPTTASIPSIASSQLYGVLTRSSASGKPYTSKDTGSSPPYPSPSRESISGLPRSRVRGASEEAPQSSWKSGPLLTGTYQSLKPLSSELRLQTAAGSQSVLGLIPTGTAGPYKISSLGQPKYGNFSSPHGSATRSGYASGITLGTSFTANATQASIVWGRQPACTASWKSRLAANNGTVMTTKVYSRTVSLPTPFTSTWAVSEYITGPTTETINVGESHKIFKILLRLDFGTFCMRRMT